MKKHHYAGWVIAAILGSVLAINTCNPRPKDTLIYNNWEPKYEWDTVREYYTFLDTVYEDTIIYQPVPAKVDTQAILKDYFAKKTYSRDYTDSNINITIADTVSKNALGHYTLSYQWKKPVTIQTYKISGPVAGVEFNGQKLGLSVGYITKKQWVYDAALYTDYTLRLGVKKVIPR